MSSLYERGRHGITREEMCVIERRADGSLQTAFHPISYDYEVLGRLRELSEGMKAWEERQTERLLDTIKPLANGVAGIRGDDVRSVVGHFRDTALDVYQTLGIGVDTSIRPKSGSHDDWHYPSGVHLLASRSTLIRGFDVSYEAIDACRSSLEEPDYLELEWAYYQASRLRPHLLAALEEYERAFSAYVEKAKQVLPEIFDKKSFCRKFSATYGSAELDYTISPGNECIVRRIDEYYWACVLKTLYSAYESTRSVVAYSHRRLGFNKYRLTLELRCGLHLLQETNFGYGSAKYFWTTLSYMGVSAINAPFLIFFHGAGKVRFSEHTFNYEVEEESFEACFDDAVRIHSEYREMGEEGFVDKYFRKSLVDLSSLLTIVANTDTFLQVTTLRSFDALTSGSTNALIPNEGFERMSFELTQDEERTCDAIVKAILSIRGTWDVEQIVTNPRICELLNKALGRYESTGLQLIIKKDLVRSHIVKELAPAISSRRDVGKLAKRLIAPDDGVFVETYEGYDLISMRVDKALSAIRPIKRLRKIAALTRFESIIDSILSTCAQIGEQAQDHVSMVIEPELNRIVPERDWTKAQLDTVRAEMERAGYEGTNLSWIEDQSRKLKLQLRQINGQITELEQRRNKLSGYVQTVSALRSPGLRNP